MALCILRDLSPILIFQMRDTPVLFEFLDGAGISWGTIHMLPFRLLLLVTGKCHSAPQFGAY